MGSTFLVIGLVALLAILAVAGLTLFEKIEKKPKPKPVIMENKETETKPDTVEIRPVSSGEESVVTEQKKVQDEFSDNSVRFRRQQSIRDYHKTRWQNKCDTILSLDDSDNGEPCEMEITVDDVKKMVALKGLFDSKREG
jgi:hypothetical protein